MIVVGIIAIAVIWMFSTCGCTHGGAYGLYEGVTDIASSKENAGVTIKTSTPEVAVNSNSGDAKATGTAASSAKSENSKNEKVPAPAPASPNSLNADKKGSSSVASTASEAKPKEGYTNLMGYNSNNSTVNWGYPAPVYAYVPPSQNNPLSQGELNMFAGTDFKPQCCPSTYSNSMGCACISKDQYNYLITRGGNNVPFAII